MMLKDAVKIYRSNSSTAQKTATDICISASDGPNRNRRSNSTLLKQPQCSANLLLVKILQTLLQSAARAASSKLQ